MCGWMDGWIGVKAVFKIAFSNQKESGKRRNIVLVIFALLQSKYFTSQNMTEMS